jgi:VanZ family protein
MPKPYLPALLWLLLVTGASIMPSVQLPKFELLAPDKFGHAFAYCVLTVLLLRGYAGATPARPAWTAAAFSMLWGVLMEYVQFFFLPGRFYEYDDMLANGVGALIGWGLVWMMQKFS